MIVREQGGGTSDVAFDYVVHGLRIGFEESGPVREKTREAYIPSMRDHRTRYERHPELERFRAFERFRQTEAQDADDDALDLSRAAALKEAIGEYDPAVHGAVLSLRDRIRPESGQRADRSTERAPASERNDAGHDVPRPGTQASGVVMDTASTPDVPVATRGGDRLPASKPVGKGQVVAFDPLHPGSVRPADTMADPAVLGVAVAASGPSEKRAVDGWLEVEIAVAGLVDCRVDAGYGSIRAGDLLMASPTAGHAMRALDAAPGTILGKAAEPLEAGVGTIRVLVMPR
jgi:hypothetical protein